MRHAATTFVTIAFLVLTAALPSNATERATREAPPPLPEVSSPATHLLVGLFATAVQLGVYGGCLALGGEASACIVSADNASRLVVGRETIR